MEKEIKGIDILALVAIAIMVFISFHYFLYNPISQLKGYNPISIALILCMTACLVGGSMTALYVFLRNRK